MLDGVKREKELEVLLKEYERLSNEMGFHFGIQSQLKTIALLLIGAIATAASFLLPLNLFQKVNPIIPLIALLLISFLFTSLQLAYQLQILEFVFIGLYIDQTLRPRVCELLKIRDTDQFFSWDRFHTQQIFPKNGFGRFVYAVLILSLYPVMAGPALVALITTIVWIVLVRFPIFSLNISSCSVLFLLIFDICYVLMMVVCAVYGVETQKKVGSKTQITMRETGKQ